MPPTVRWDARYFQMGFQLLLLFYGLLYLHWSVDWLHYIIYVSSAVILQLSIEFFTYKNYDSWKSALISSLSLCLLLKTNHWYTCLLATEITILSKYVLRYKGKHIFNPSAIGIIATIYITDNAWLSSGQWGSGFILLLTVSVLGFIVVTKVQKLDISLAFLLTYTALIFSRQILYLHWPTDSFLQSISTGSLLLFSFFMISEPKTAPNHPAARIVWAMLIAAIAFYLSVFKWMYNTPILILVLAAPLVPFLDKLFRYKKFEWKHSPFELNKI
ncbi:MAG: RnfABCDGE type electron transport complex subunit D [Bacteroidetes bacterium]|nr:RnfABCDGE type electron transport complex subunit D [Bacteroidota bacterium]